MPDTIKIITPNIPLTESHFDSLLDHAVDSGVSAEQLASQIVQQWICMVLEPDRVRTKYR